MVFLQRYCDHIAENMFYTVLIGIQLWYRENVFQLILLPFLSLEKLLKIELSVSVSHVHQFHFYSLLL